MDLLLKSLTGKDVDKIPVFPVGLTSAAKLIQRAGLPGGKKGLADALET